MSAGGGGAWKVAYADFVTAMMAFFLVMWITAQSNAVKQSIARYFQHPFDAASRSPVSSKSSSGASLVPLHRDMDGSIPHGNVHGKSPRGGGMLADDQPPADPKSVPKSGGLRRRTGVMLTENDPTGTGAFVQFETKSAGLSDSAKRLARRIIALAPGKAKQGRSSRANRKQRHGQRNTRRCRRRCHRPVATFLRALSGRDEVPGAKWGRSQTVPLKPIGRLGIALGN